MTLDTNFIRECLEVYLVANTPLYLYKRLRRLQAVQRLGRSTDAKELLLEYSRLAATEERSPDDVAAAYGCLVAMTHQDPLEATPLLRSLNRSSLDWALALRDLYLLQLPSGGLHRFVIATPRIPAVTLATDASATCAKTHTPRPEVHGKADI